MTHDWQVQAATGRCSTTGRELLEGEEFYTVLFEEGESFRRQDYSVEAWQGPPDGAFCHFHSRVPIREKKKRLLVDDDILVNFFLRLANEQEPVRVHFRFVLALILLRKRKLRYEYSTKKDGIETSRMTLLSDRSEHAVVNPRLSDEQIEQVSQELGAIICGTDGPACATDLPVSGADIPACETDNPDCGTDFLVGRKE